MEKVLLVDDELDALEVLGFALRDCGCDVRTTTSSDEALELGREFAPTVAIVDYLLGDRRNGVDLIRALRELDPALRVILITGMQVDGLEAELDRIGDVPLVRKPFQWQQLRSRLNL